MNVASSIALGLIALVTGLGFLASRWQTAGISRIEDWALGGRRFGTIVSWFLLGGDLYTAYTFVAVPALVYGVGALGFFAVPYATIAYPIAFLLFPLFWKCAAQRGYLTLADFIRDRFSNRALEVAIALTGIVAAMPYIALQLLGMRSAFVRLGGIFAAHGGATALIVAFALLAAYTYTSGLRAPALIAFVKDTLIYVTVIAAIIVIPAALGGWHHIFDLAAAHFAARTSPGRILLPPGLQAAYATLALGSAFSLFLYPHSITSLLAAKNADVIARNTALLPIYSLLLAFLALLGICGVAAGIVTKSPNDIVPILFARYFPSWFVGVADTAIIIGALVPAAIIAIGAANIITSNVLTHFHEERPPGELRTAKRCTLIVCACALIPVFFIPVQYTIYLQLLGGGIMLQALPAFVIGLFAPRIDGRVLLVGWCVGIASAIGMALANGFAPTILLHVAGLGFLGATSLDALAANLLVIALASLFVTTRRTA